MTAIQEYIDSGILELYVYGKLNAVEIEEVQKMALQHEQVRQEILSIEQALILISGSVAPPLSIKNYEVIKSNLLNQDSSFIEKPLQKDVKSSETENTRSKAIVYLGWIAAILIASGSYYYYTLFQKDSKQKEISFEAEKTTLKSKLIELKTINDEAEHLITVFRDTSNFVVPLQGQDVAPKAFAKIFWNKENKTIYIDALGLPNPPHGMVYQVWSFKLNPLTPTSLGILDTYKKDGRKFFKVYPSSDSDAFGISLEPAGGSETPTLEQLFTLGKV